MNTRILRTSTILLGIILAAVDGLAADAEPPLNPAITALISAAKAAAKPADRLNKSAAVGVSVLDVTTGETLCSIDDQRLMTPASNVKLVTTAAALLLLGADHEFTTSVYSFGDVRGGVLNGHLIVVADGDPAISGREHDGQPTAVFDALAAAIAKTAKTVRGSLIIDDTAFDRQYLHPDWPPDQLVRWYCAPVSAFALNDNCIDVSVRPAAQADRPALVTLAPDTQYFEVRNTCTTIAAGPSKVNVSRLPNSDTLVISGKIALKNAGSTTPVAVLDPTLFAATVLKERLAAAGVQVKGPILFAQEHADTSRLQLLASTSHSLGGAVRTANKRSQNFYAEMILKTLGRKVVEPASFAAGVRSAATVLDDVGIKEGTYVLSDGSGLSKRNAFSADQFSRLLRSMARSPQAAAFIDSLPVSGVEGSLSNRMNAPAYAGKVLAKTGHVLGVSALSGYIRSGERFLAFSILVNDDGLNIAAANALQDRICELLVDFRLP